MTRWVAIKLAHLAYWLARRLLRDLEQEYPEPTAEIVLLHRYRREMAQTIGRGEAT